MREIPLANSRRVALVDDEDYEMLTDYRWVLTNPKPGALYAREASSIFAPQMQHLLLPAKEGFVIDHINHRGLDNQRGNLRYATRSQNGANTGPNARNKSGYKGVDKRPDRLNTWRASIRIDGKSVRLGTFHSPEDAARAYDKAAKEHHGEFAYLNNV